MSAEARAVAMVCTAEILSLAGFSLVPALLPQFMTIWSLSNAQGGWLAGIMSGGYMLAVLPLVVLTDRVPARSVFLASSALGAVLLRDCSERYLPRGPGMACGVGRCDCGYLHAGPAGAD